MKSYPIIFSAAMIRALLAGTKTQTRRIVTRQWSNLKMHHDMGTTCVLWVRESCWLYSSAEGQTAVAYRADAPPGAKPLPKRSGEIIADAPKKTTPSIHMPRWASRLTLEVTNVRVQRLHEISEGDALAEGCEPDRSSAQHAYQSLWETLHGAGSWSEDPEIVAMTFRVHRQNVDGFIAESR